MVNALREDRPTRVVCGLPRNLTLGFSSAWRSYPSSFASFLISRSPLGRAARKVIQYAARKVIQSEGGSFYVFLCSSLQREPA
jgi:hypothetical protein